MTRFWKTLLCVGLLAAGVRSAPGFALLGPFNETWHVGEIGFNLPGDIGAPKNYAEEYRRNTPVMYYSFDTAFLDYFGSNGVWAVEQAFAVFNNLTNVSDYSPELTEFPLSTMDVNYRASALGLMDIKSAVLSLILEQMGLAEPERYTWVIHNRGVFPNGSCPDNMFYFVVRRNFGIVPSALDALQYSSYVNGNLLTYYIYEDCNENPRQLNPAADAVEIAVDPINDPLSAVASWQLNSIDLGAFYSGLTRDDVAGLRYLLRYGNLNWESLSDDSLLFSTNARTSALNFLTTSNLYDLNLAASTNDAAGLLAVYPGLLILNTTPYLTNEVSTNLTAYFTNWPWDPAGSPQRLVFATNFVTNVVFRYQHTFGNIISNTLVFPNGYVFTNQAVFTNGLVVTSNKVTVIETNIGYQTGGFGTPSGDLVTNVTVKTMWTNMVVGEFFLPPTNLCGVLLLSNVLTQVSYVTNILEATNAVASSNFQFFSRTIITPHTNHNFAYFPVDCVTNATTLYRGVEKIRFIRRDYDSLLGRFFEPVQTNYNIVAVTNSQNRTQTVARLVVRPDFVFTAEDMLPGPLVNPPLMYPAAARSIQFGTNSATLAGPGTILPGTLITFDKGRPVRINEAINFMDEETAFLDPAWGSYDESTNAPVVFPNGASLEALENQVIIQITTTTLPDGRYAVAYETQLAAQGGTPPYQWGLAPTSPGLPPGLQLSADGTLSGIPFQAATFDFILRVTDSGGRYVDRATTLTIAP